MSNGFIAPKEDLVEEKPSKGFIAPSSDVEIEEPEKKKEISEGFLPLRQRPSVSVTQPPPISYHAAVPPSAISEGLGAESTLPTEPVLPAVPTYSGVSPVPVITEEEKNRIEAKKKAIKEQNILESPSLLSQQREATPEFERTEFDQAVKGARKEKVRELTEEIFKPYQSSKSTIWFGGLKAKETGALYEKLDLTKNRIDEILLEEKYAALSNESKMMLRQSLVNREEYEKLAMKAEEKVVKLIGDYETKTGKKVLLPTKENQIALTDELSFLDKTSEESIARKKNELIVSSKREGDLIQNEYKAENNQLTEGLKQQRAAIETQINTGSISQQQAQSHWEAIQQDYNTQNLQMYNRYTRRANKRMADMSLSAQMELKKSFEEKYKAAFDKYGMSKEKAKIYEDLFKLSISKVQKDKMNAAWKVWNEKNPVEKLGSALLMGVGDMIDVTGGALKWLGFDEAGLALTNHAEATYGITGANELLLPEFQWSDMRKSDWWYLRGARMAPLTASLIVPGIGVAGAVSTTAAKIGLSTVGRAVFTGVAGAVATRPMESFMEAGGVYQQFIREGKTQEEASQAAANVFSGNMGLIFSDAIQLGLAFTPIKNVVGRIAKWTSMPVTEGFEEVYQEFLNERQNNPLLSFMDYAQSPSGQEVFALGAATGLLFNIPDAFGKTPVIGLRQFENKTISNLLKSDLTGDVNKRIEQIKNTVDVLEIRGQIAPGRKEEIHKQIDFVSSKLKDMPEKLDENSRTALLDKLQEIDDLAVKDVKDETIKSALQDDEKELKKEAKDIINGEAPLYIVDGISMNKEQVEVLLGNADFQQQMKNGTHKIEVSNDEKFSEFVENETKKLFVKPTEVPFTELADIAKKEKEGIELLPEETTLKETYPDEYKVEAEKITPAEPKAVPSEGAPFTREKSFAAFAKDFPRIMKEVGEQQKPFRDKFLEKKKLTLEEYRKLSDEEKQKIQDEWVKSDEFKKMNEEFREEAKPPLAEEIKPPTAGVPAEKPITPAGGEVKPIRQLGTGANVYFETEKYRVNDWGGKILLNIGDAKGLVPLKSVEFNNAKEAVFVAEKLHENAPKGLDADFHNVDKIIENYKQEYIKQQPPLKAEPEAKVEPVVEKPIVPTKFIEPEFPRTNENYTENEAFKEVSGKYDIAPKETGRTTTEPIASGDLVKGKYILIDADNITPTHNEKTFAKSKGVPVNERGETINDRNYEADKSAQASVISHSEKFDRRAVKDVPIMTKDGIVFSGNDRTMARKLSAEKETDADYMEGLREKAEMYGIDPAKIDNFKKPMLVFELEKTPEYSTREFRKYNVEEKKAKGTLEEAVEISKSISQEAKNKVSNLLSRVSGVTELQASKVLPQLRDVLLEEKIITQEAIPKYFDAEGKLTETGKDLLENIVLGSIFKEAELRTLNEAGMKSLRNKLSAAGFELSENSRYAEFNVLEHLKQAIEIKRRQVVSGDPMELFAIQEKIFEKKEIDPAALNFLFDIEEKGVTNFKKTLQGLNNIARDYDGEAKNLFGGIVKPEEVINQFIQNKYESLNEHNKRLADAAKRFAPAHPIEPLAERPETKPTPEKVEPKPAEPPIAPEKPAPEVKEKKPPTKKEIKEKEDEERKKVQENLKKKTGEFISKVKDVPKQNPDNESKLYLKIIPISNIFKLFSKVQQPLRELKNRIETAIANSVKIGITSQNNFVRNISTILTNQFGGVVRTSEDLAQKLKFEGTVKRFALDESQALGKDLYNLLDNDFEAAKRIHSVLDPELYEPSERLKYGELNDKEKKVYDFLKEINEWSHDTNFANGFIDLETYSKFKDKYIGRAYKEYEMPSEIDEFIQYGNNSFNGTTKLETGIYKARKEINDWMAENKISDPIYLTMKRYMQTIQNDAIKKYIDYNIAKNPKLISDEPKKGFVKMDDSKIWGDLKGKYVATHIVNDFKGFFYANEVVNTFYSAAKVYDRTKFRQFMKKFHTVYSPFVQIGNMSGNYMFAFISGIDPVTFSANIPKAISEIKNRGEIYKTLLREGYLGSAGITEDMLPLIEKDTKILSATEKTQKGLKNVFRGFDEKATDLYGGADNVAKISAYMVYREQGLSERQAKQKVYDSFQNYGTVGKNWDFASKIPVFGNPYIKFQADLQRIIKNGISSSPLTTIGAIMLLKMFGDLLSDLSGEEEEKKKIREARKGIPKIPLPFGLSVPLVWQTKYGEINVARYVSPLYLYDVGYSEADIQEISRFLPIQLINIGEEAIGEKKILPAFGDPFLGTIAQVIFDIDFRGKSIQNPDATRYKNPNPTITERIINSFNYVARGNVPFYKNIMDFKNAMEGELDYYGRERDWKQSILNNIIKIQDFGDEQVRTSIEKEISYYTKKFVSLTQRIADANEVASDNIKEARERKITPQQLDEIINNETKRRNERILKSSEEQKSVYRELEKSITKYTALYKDMKYVNKNNREIKTAQRKSEKIKKSKP